MGGKDGLNFVMQTFSARDLSRGQKNLIIFKTVLRGNSVGYKM